jgi:hypothetical protein
MRIVKMTDNQLPKVVRQHLMKKSNPPKKDQQLLANQNQHPIAHRPKKVTKLLNISQEMIEFMTKLLQKPRRKLKKRLKRKQKK